MTRGELVEELAALGHRYIKLARRQEFVDRAVRRIVHSNNWPYRFTVSTLETVNGSVGGQIDDVTFSNRRIPMTTRSDLVERGISLSDVGDPESYYLEGAFIKTWPIASDPAAVTVSQFSRAAWQSGGLVAANDSDLPILPVDFDDLILLESRVHCLEDTDEDGLRDAIAERAVVEAQRLLDLHLNRNADEADSIEQRTGEYA